MAKNPPPAPFAGKVSRTVVTLNEVNLTLACPQMPASPVPAIEAEMAKVVEQLRQSPDGQALEKQQARLAQCRQALAEAQRAADAATEARAMKVVAGEDFDAEDEALTRALAAVERRREQVAALAKVVADGESKMQSRWDRERNGVVGKLRDAATQRLRAAQAAFAACLPAAVVEELGAAAVYEQAFFVSPPPGIKARGPLLGEPTVKPSPEADEAALVALGK
jgi:hypothetical protein